MEDANRIKSLDNWTEVSKGFYRFVIGANVCYEIHILYHIHSTNILNAKANLYLVGDWKSNKTGVDFFERECLLSSSLVTRCLQSAFKDYTENMEG